MKPASLVVLLAVLVAAFPALPQERPAGTARSLAAEIQPFVDSNTLAGAVLLVASKDRVLDVETVGYADVAAKKPMQNDSVFWIASMSKPITAAGLMILVDEGK